MDKLEHLFHWRGKLIQQYSILLQVKIYTKMKKDFRKDIPKRKIFETEIFLVGERKLIYLL